MKMMKVALIIWKIYIQRRGQGRSKEAREARMRLNGGG